MSVEVLLLFVACVAVLWIVARWALRGADLSAFDQPTGERFSRGDAPSAEVEAVIASLGGIRDVLRGVPLRQRNAVLRKYMDEIFAGRELNARIVPVDGGGVPRRMGAGAGRRPVAAHAVHPRRRLHHGQPEEPPHADLALFRAHRRCGAGHRLPADARAPAPRRHRGLPQRLPLAAAARPRRCAARDRRYSSPATRPAAT